MTSAKLPMFIDFGNDKSILAQKSKTGKLWYMISEVLAPQQEKFDLFMEFVDHVFNKENSSRLQIEINKIFREELNERLGDSGFRCGPLNYKLEWPLYNMKEWDGDLLPGKKWKKIRNIKNRFFEEHKVEIVDSITIPKDILKNIVVDWIKERESDDFAYKECYFRLIDSNFVGCDVAKTVIVDSIPCSITAGWKIPNSNNYYSSVGILNYRFDGLGEIINLYDLIELKNRGFDKVNFGGSDEELLGFKKKFKPVETYDTYIFSIMRKKDEV